MSTKPETNDLPPEGLLEEYKTDWTSDGRYRIDVSVWRTFVALTCETEGVVLPKRERFGFCLGKVIVLTGNLRPDSERFVEHAFSFYSPQLAAMAVDALRKVFDALQAPDPNATPMQPPPRGEMN